MDWRRLSHTVTTKGKIAFTLHTHVNVVFIKTVCIALTHGAHKLSLGFQVDNWDQVMLVMPIFETCKTTRAHINAFAWASRTVEGLLYVRAAHVAFLPTVITEPQLHTAMHQSCVSREQSVRRV